jgi:DNA-binding protein H-NS
MDEFVNQIKEEIKENDFELKAVIDLLQNELKGTNKKSSDSKTRIFKVFVDPDNPQNTYKTGPLPPWMKDKMKEQGLDPNKKEDVKEFKKKLNIKE